MAKKNKSAQIFAALNLSEDSFSYKVDSSEAYAPLEKARQFKNDGVEILDIGAVSTRPGADLDSGNEASKIIDFLRRLKAEDLNFKISIDTFNYESLEKIYAAGFSPDFINDVTALADARSAKFLADKKCQIVLMHADSLPPSPSKDVADDLYPNGLYASLKEFFTERISFAESFGIAKERLILDPGLGFGKNLKHSFDLLADIPKLKNDFALPVLIGHSRKSFLLLWDEFSGRDSITERDRLTKLYSALALEAGADYLRLHNAKI